MSFTAVFRCELSIKGRLNGSYFLHLISKMELFNLQSKIAATLPHALR